MQHSLLYSILRGNNSIFVIPVTSRIQPLCETRVFYFGELFPSPRAHTGCRHSSKVRRANGHLSRSDGRARGTRALPQTSCATGCHSRYRRHTCGNDQLPLMSAQRKGTNCVHITYTTLGITALPNECTVVMAGLNQRPEQLAGGFSEQASSASREGTVPGRRNYTRAGGVYSVVQAASRRQGYIWVLQPQNGGPVHSLGD